jgi:hypothetical protein
MLDNRGVQLCAVRSAQCAVCDGFVYAVRQCAAVLAAVCGSACGSVQPSGSAHGNV